MPQRMLGLTMLPPVSLPMEKPTRPAAVAAPGPALEPEAPSSSSHGFTVWPPNQMSLSARAPRLSFARRTAPAVFAGRDFFVGPFGLGEREIACESDDAAELGIELLHAMEVDFGKAPRS